MQRPSKDAVGKCQNDTENGRFGGFDTPHYCDLGKIGLNIEHLYCRWL